jgi:hypothetical protein
LPMTSNSSEMEKVSTKKIQQQHQQQTYLTFQ